MDCAIATNIISVGLDIPRLGLMVVVGQPKTHAEYIQATSRVGRDDERPGLIVTLLNIHKQPDRLVYQIVKTALLHNCGGQTMNLEHEFTYVATLKPPVQIGAGPFGTRNFFEVTGGTVEGKRLKGKILTGGGDWLLNGPDGYARLDVRAQFLTDDGASLYVHYTGLLQMNQKVADALEKGASTDYGDQYFRTTPRFETGDPRYAWLNQSVFVAEGRVGPGRVEYKVYRVA